MMHCVNDLGVPARRLTVKTTSPRPRSFLAPGMLPGSIALVSFRQIAFFIGVAVMLSGCGGVYSTSIQKNQS